MNTNTNTDTDTNPNKDNTKTLYYSKIIEDQGLITIITLGHVAHGKSTLVRSITGVKTQKHKAELERNITINLGYANAKIWVQEAEGKIQALPSHAKSPGKDWRLAQHISFIDCPGHESLMSTMISGAHNFDVGFLLIAGNDRVVPQTQTYEHLLALAAVGKGIPQGLVLHNKLDLLTHEESATNLSKIKEFLDGSPAQGLDIIPISAQSGDNVDEVLKYLTRAEPRRMENINDPAELVVIRSFNVNKPNATIAKLTGGVIGGSLKSGHLKVGDYLEISPGVVEGDYKSGWTCRPLVARVTSLFSERRSLDVAIPGGLLGIGTSLDAGLTKSNKLVGQMATHIGHALPIVQGLTLKYRRMNRMDSNSATTAASSSSKTKTKREKGKNSKELVDGETIRVCVHATSVEGQVTGSNKKEVSIQLRAPVSCSESDNIVVMRMIGGRWTLSGTGTIISIKPVNHVILPQGYEAIQKEFEARRLKEPINLVNDLRAPQIHADADAEAEAEAEAEADADADAKRYEALLKNIRTLQTGKDEKMAIVAPKLRPHNRVTIWENFMSVMESIKCGYPGADESAVDPKHLIDVQKHFLKFLSEELAATYSINGEMQLIINGKFRDGHAEKVLRNYLKQFRTCINCGKMDSFLYKSRHLTMSYCNYCNSERTISGK